MQLINIIRVPWYTIWYIGIVLGKFFFCKADLLSSWWHPSHSCSVSTGCANVLEISDKWNIYKKIFRVETIVSETIYLGQTVQIWVAEVEWSQNFINHCFYGIFGHYIIRLKVPNPKSQTSPNLWGGWVGSQVWEFFKGNVFGGQNAIRTKSRDTFPQIGFCLIIVRLLLCDGWQPVQG